VITAGPLFFAASPCCNCGMGQPCTVPSSFTRGLYFASKVAFFVTTIYGFFGYVATISCAKILRGKILMKISTKMNLEGASRRGIRFNNRVFTEPMPFSLARPPVSSGVYAILAPDASFRPRPFRVIYFGESHNFSHCITGSHERFSDWTLQADGAANLYVAFCPTPLLRELQRRWVENDLIVRYRPACNLRDNHPHSFYQPLLSLAK
jgi:hypothetical protein